jgi:hypothetical protein
MPEYLFRFPASMPELTYAGLGRTDRIGRTVRVDHWPMTRVLRLYGTVIARIYEDRVEFPVTGDQHQATREWLVRIVRDNGIGNTVWRDRRGVLLVDGTKNRPVEGCTFKVTRRETTTA